MTERALEGFPVSPGLFGALAGASLSRRIVWATAARLIALIVLLFFIALLNVKGEYSSDSFTTRASLSTLAIAFALSGVYATQLRLGWNLEGLVRVQLVADQAFGQEFMDRQRSGARGKPQDPAGGSAGTE